MKRFLGAVLFSMLLFGGVSTASAAQISLGIRIGDPPPPRVIRRLPPRPGAEFVWIDGYWYPVGHHYKWHDGYWTRPPYEGARWMGPRHENGQFFEGYWEGGRGRFEHDHRWDRDRNRDRDRFRDDHRDHDDRRDHDDHRDHDNRDHDNRDHDNHH
jgi:hypothetical protein